MAIDMIENNELGALASGRFSELKPFIDQNKHYKNAIAHSDFPKIDSNEEFANLFGINIFGDETFKSNKNQSQKEAEDFIKSLPATKCEDIQTALDKIAIYIETQTKALALAKGHMTEYPKIKLEVARKAEGDLKQKQQDYNCIALAQAAESAKSKDELIKTLTNVSQQSVEQAKTDLFGLPASASVYTPTGSSGTSTSNILTSSNKNLLLYGGIGVGVILLILFIRKD